ncbi:uncharacterized protein GGS22DRAFT_178468 [Annulohypoxylon maeteangense]|uniref:uncharacterized protein n=1 Tax=Annulohypoxylon maeteangense TaxID=1927788 RepID=UPI002008743F|nr:uncharacterized protein GGS22DRAFT_178468 [Annulohypoxylon maeteangense]KAI0887285.1 hypothetical protein GGS22DRAFT_178468 [Annulohypoxylon maeteangense]
MSSDAFTHQVPINGTMQTKVLPGNQTNLYYILVSNLPWQTTWRQLKNHVRAVCMVDRVEVFNESTSGWVSVWGRDNYDAALRLLNGGIFNGRALLADGKNISETIMIRESVVPSKAATGSSKTASKAVPKTVSKVASKTASKASSKSSGSTSKTTHASRFKTPPSTQYAASTPPLMSPHATGYGEWTSPATSSLYTATSSMECAPYTASSAMPPDYSETPNCYTYDTSSSSYLDQSTMVSPSTMVQYPYDTGFSQQYQVSGYQNNDYAMYNSMPSPEPITPMPNDPSNSMVPTKQRKIIVKQIQPSINVNQVQDLIRKKAGSDADKIQHVDLPLTEGQASNRGYALVTFQSEEVASKLIRRLNGYKYEGRELRVDYTKEGVSENENVKHRSSGHKERRDDREKKSKKESTREPSSHDKKNKSHKSGVVIAYGTSSSSSPKKPDSKEKSSKRH